MMLLYLNNTVLFLFEEDLL